MRKALIHTFFAVFLASLVLIIVPPLILLFYVCAPFPTYLAVLIYQFVKQKKFPNNKVYAFLFGGLLLFIICQLGFILYMFIGSIPFRSPYVISDIIDEYKGDVAEVSIFGGLIAIFVPLADILIEKIKRDIAEEKEKERVRKQLK
jgi:hypothetical protein